MKKCSKCKILKTEPEFYNNKSKHDGLSSECKLCNNIRNSIYAEKNKEKMQEYKRNYNEENKDKYREYFKEYRDNNKKKIAIRSKLYRDENKEYISEKRKIYYHDNQDKIIELSKKNYKKHRERILKRVQKWNIDNKSKRREYLKDNRVHIAKQKKEYNSTDSSIIRQRISNQKRRALKISSDDGTISKQSLLELIKLQNNKCHHCGDELGSNKHLDHYIPLSKGGANSINNVCYSCPSCNMSKGAKVPITLMLI